MRQRMVGMRGRQEWEPLGTAEGGVTSSPLVSGGPGRPNQTHGVVEEFSGPPVLVPVRTRSCKHSI